MLFYQDVNEQFEGYTQQGSQWNKQSQCCFIRMSMNNLKDIHNERWRKKFKNTVVLSGCQ